MTRHVWQYIENASERFPQKIAFSDENGTCTYAEFRTKCEKFAMRLLQNRESKPEPARKPVAVFLEKSIDALMAFFSCAATGHFYAPLDVKTPHDRLKKMLDTLQPATVITHTRWRDIIKDILPQATIECVDENTERHAAEGKACSAPKDLINGISRKIIDTDILYVIFTSGSSGNPKGVCVSHRAIIDYAEWASDTFQLDDSVRQGNLGPFYFDLSVHDIFCTVRNGSFLRLIPENAILFPKNAIDILNRDKIDSIFWVPSALAHIANSRILSSQPPQHLKRVMFCGEVMSPKHLAVWQEAIPNALYVNLYGPTEATEACTFHIVDRTYEPGESIPIGKPCLNTEIIIIDADGSAVSDTMKNTVGELYIRGSSLSHGYYNEPKQTQNVFVQNPLHNNYPDTVYRTGDLVKFNKQGELMFVGRSDTQIKKQGYRIELGEIDAAALAQQSVERACTVYQNESGNIVLFVQCAGAEPAQIESGIRNSLPKYMWPSKVQVLPEIPLNSNGKYDRIRLLEMADGL